MHGGVHGRAFNPSNNRNISGGAQWPAQIYLLYTTPPIHMYGVV